MTNNKFFGENFNQSIAEQEELTFIENETPQKELQNTS